MNKSSGGAAEKRADGMPRGTPFSKGKSGNPAGRVKGSISIKAELQKLLDLTMKGQENPLTEKTEDMPVGRKIALNLILKAAKEGDVWAALRIMEQLDGKPPQSVKLGGDEGNPIETIFTLKIDNS